MHIEVKKSSKFGMVCGYVVIALISHPRLCVVVGKKGDTQRLGAYSIVALTNFLNEKVILSSILLRCHRAE
jgi:hypothetical protein